MRKGLCDKLVNLEVLGILLSVLAAYVGPTISFIYTMLFVAVLSCAFFVFAIMYAMARTVIFREDMTVKLLRKQVVMLLILPILTVWAVYYLFL